MSPLAEPGLLADHIFVWMIWKDFFLIEAKDNSEVAYLNTFCIHHSIEISDFACCLNFCILILFISGARNLQELAEVTARACGGIHTLTYPHSQAIVRGLQLNSEFDFLVPDKDFRPVDILGQDGHIYKGLLDSLPPTLPRIPQKNKSHGTKNPPRSSGRSTTPSSAKAHKSAADELESA